MLALCSALQNLSLSCVHAHAHTETAVSPKFTEIFLAKISVYLVLISDQYSKPDIDAL